MKEYLPILQKSNLFAGVAVEEIAAMLACLDGKLRTYKRGEYVLREGECLRHIMVLVEGELHIQRDDYWGNRTIVNRVAVGDMFGEAYVAREEPPLQNDVVAVEDSAVIFFDVRRVMTVCSSACRFHAMVVQNLVFAISEKNRALMQKLSHISRRSTREKLISYLSAEAKRQGSADFTIPFNRQELADFLSVDRSAMSAELGKMRDEGLLRFEKNRFRLLERESET